MRTGELLDQPDRLQRIVLLFGYRSMKFSFKTHLCFLISDVTSTTNGDNSSVDRDSNDKNNPSANPGASGKQLIGNEGIRSKSLFDVEGAIDFDFCENGDIDLR